MRTQVEQRFENGDPVREYWLARGEGFAVESRRGRVLGRVVDVVLDPEEGRIERIVVQAHGLRAVRGRTAEIAAREVAAAVPARKAFVLDGGQARRRRPAARAARTGWRRLRPYAAAAWRGVVAVGSALGALGLLAARYAAVLLRALAQRVRHEWALARGPR